MPLARVFFFSAYVILSGMKNVSRKPITMKTIANLITDSHESLARSIAEGFRGVDKRFEEVDKRFEAVDKRFEAVDKRFEEVDKRFEAVDKRFDGIGQQIQGLANRIDDLALNRATRDELIVLDKRVARIETKLGIDFRAKQHSS